MDDPGTWGLSRRQLEYEVKWKMRKAPDEFELMPEFLTEVMITLIEKNNQAIASAMAEQDRQDLPETA